MTEVREESLTGHPLMPQLGQVVAGRYKILGVLGEGGFSVVYLAKDELAGGKVALKVLGPAKSKNPRFTERFHREVRVVRELRHHHTIQVFDTGTTDQGCLFMVTEYLIGETLAALVGREAPLPPDRVVRISLQILRALAEAHRLGVIHRDLKPANVMICDVAGEEDYVKVLDFGVAKAEIIDKQQLQTSPYEFLYTPQYAAPEVLTGDRVTPATDLYSLGLIMIEMLTGRKAVQGTTVWHILALQVSSQPIEIPPEIADHPVSRVVHRAVLKDAGQRHPSAEAMLEELLSPEVAQGDRWPWAGEIGRTPRATVSRSTDGAADDQQHRTEGGSETASPSRERSRAASGPSVLQLGSWPVARRWAVLVGLALLVLIGGGIWLRGSRIGKPPSIPPDRPWQEATGDPLSMSRSEQQRCDDGDYRACLDLARRYEVGQGVDPDPLRTLALLDRACREGMMVQACLDLSVRYLEGQEVPAEPALAVEYLETACAAGDLEACLGAGYRYLNGEGVDADPVRAHPLLQRACEEESPLGCAGLATLYANGRGVAQDLPRAVQLYTLACNGGVFEACTRLGVLVLQGQGVGTDYSTALALFDRSCRHEDQEGCVGLATLYHRGLGVDLDGRRAYQLYEGACLGGSGTGCTGLGALLEQGLGVPRDPDRSRAFYRKACSMGAAIACFNLGQLLEQEPGPSSDDQAVRQFYQQACELGHERACEAVSDREAE